MQCKDIPERFTIRTVSPHLPDEKPVSPYSDDFTCTEIKPTSANLLEKTKYFFSSIASSYIGLTSGNSKYRAGDVLTKLKNYGVYPQIACNQKHELQEIRFCFFLEGSAFYKNCPNKLEGNNYCNKENDQITFPSSPGIMTLITSK
ncbi:hypothetical protein Gotur_002283 [Gossypium turneri]